MKKNYVEKQQNVSTTHRKTLKIAGVAKGNYI